MQRKFAIVLLIPCITLLLACEKDPAREQLERMNVKYGKKEFIRRVEQSDRDVVELFLAGGMSSDTRGEEGRTALMHAAHRGNTEIAKLLVEHGANVNAKSKLGITALNSAVAGLHYYGEGGGHIEIIQFLVKRGVDVNAQAKYPDGALGETALMNAARAGNLDIVRLLVEHGANVNARGQDNWTALMWAARNAPPEIVQHLLEYGADPNAETDFGATALSIAKVNNNKPEVIKILMHAGAK